jgi:hypothetical protein
VVTSDLFNTLTPLYAGFGSKNTVMKKALKKHLDIIASGHITERGIINLRTYMRNNPDDVETIKEQVSKGELGLTNDQNEKGISFLRNSYSSPSGKIRINNPFGDKQISVMKNFSHFTLCGFVKTSQNQYEDHCPIYRCYAKDGSSFKYAYSFGSGKYFFFQSKFNPA